MQRWKVTWPRSTNSSLTKPNSPGFQLLAGISSHYVCISLANPPPSFLFSLSFRITHILKRRDTEVWDHQRPRNWELSIESWIVWFCVISQDVLGGSERSAVLQLTNLVEVVYTFHWRVSDSHGSSDMDTATVEVQPGMLMGFCAWVNGADLWSGWSAFRDFCSWQGNPVWEVSCDWLQLFETSLHFVVNQIQPQNSIRSIGSAAINSFHFYFFDKNLTWSEYRASLGVLREVSSN